MKLEIEQTQISKKERSNKGQTSVKYSTKITPEKTIKKLSKWIDHTKLPGMFLPWFIFSKGYN